MQALQDALLAAVPSGLGLSITIRVGLPAVTVTTLEGTATVESSLWVPLPSPLCRIGQRGGVLRRDPRRVGGPRGGPAVGATPAGRGDAAGPAPDTPSGADPIAGLPEMSVIHRALGALLAQGRTPDAAAADLRTSADRSGTSVLTVAGNLIRALDDRSTPTADIAGRPGP